MKSLTLKTPCLPVMNATNVLPLKRNLISTSGFTVVKSRSNVLFATRLSGIETSWGSTRGPTPVNSLTSVRYVIKIMPPGQVYKFTTIVLILTRGRISVDIATRPMLINTSLTLMKGPISKRICSSVTFAISLTLFNPS